MTRSFCKHDGERGAALLEFVVLGVCVLLPLVYVVLAVMKVQAASFGVTEAARQAGRAFAQADTAANGSDRANLAARLALQDQGISVDQAQVTINCHVGRCLSPGSSATVHVATRISLPFVPDVWSDSSMTSIEVSGEYRADIEALRAAS
jgi:Flp pilus assembly protein TadG